MEEKDFLTMLEEKLKSYEELVHEKEREGLLEKETLKTYLTHSTNFVRWCKGDFEPGERNRNKK